MELNVTVILFCQVLPPRVLTSPTRLKIPCSQATCLVHFHIPQALSCVSTT